MFKKCDETVMLFLAFVLAGFDVHWPNDFEMELKWIFRIGYFDLEDISIQGDESTFKKVAKIVHTEGWKINTIRYYSNAGYYEEWDREDGYRWEVDKNPISSDMWVLKINKEGEFQSIYIHVK